MNNSRNAVLASLQSEDELAVTYRNAEGDVIPAPKPVWQPTKFKVEPGKDDFVLLNLRARRRLANRAASRAQRKGKRNYVRQAVQKAEAATDLAQLFNIADRLVPASPRMRHRAVGALADKVAAIVNADQARYDREITARQKDRTLPAPQPPMRHEDVEKGLRGIAKTATTYAPKAKRETPREEALSAFAHRELVGTVGRTGRAG
jgi:hypothetical protein